MSSAGVYLKSDEMLHPKRDPVDQKSRHKEKLDSDNCDSYSMYICGPTAQIEYQ